MRVHSVEARAVFVPLDRPVAFYRRPANRFVAEFLGRTTFVPAEVLDVNPEETVVRALGTVMRIPLGPAGPPRGAVASLGIRSEAVRVMTERGAVGLSGVIRRSAFLGQDLEYIIEVSGVRLTATVADEAGGRLDEGTSVQIEIDPRRVVLLP